MTKTLVDNATALMWHFVGANGGPGTLPSGLVVLEGDVVTVTLTNNLSVPINFVIPGTAVVNTVECPAGALRSYTFTAPAAGSYFYTDGLNATLSRAMGLMGPLVVMPNDGTNTLYKGGPTFARQYTLVLHEIDKRVNDAVQAGQVPNLAAYDPNYFFVNGLSYPDTEADADTTVDMLLNQNVAIRFINAGLIFNPMHFHGYHVNVAARNRVPETAVIEKDTVLVKTEECVDLMLPVEQAGIYQIHSHFLPAITANGVYPNGAMIRLSAA